MHIDKSWCWDYICILFLLWIWILIICKLNMFWNMYKNPKTQLGNKSHEQTLFMLNWVPITNIPLQRMGVLNKCLIRCTCTTLCFHFYPLKRDRILKSILLLIFNFHLQYLWKVLNLKDLDYMFTFWLNVL